MTGGRPTESWVNKGGKREVGEGKGEDGRRKCETDGSKFRTTPTNSWGPGTVQ